MGLAIFKKKIQSRDRRKTFKCCLEWSNHIFEQQFEIKPDSVEDHLNQRIFKDYLKSRNGKKDQRRRSLLEVLAELDSSTGQGSLFKIFEVVREKSESIQRVS